MFKNGTRIIKKGKSNNKLHSKLGCECCTCVFEYNYKAVNEIYDKTYFYVFCPNCNNVIRLEEKNYII